MKHLTPILLAILIALFLLKECDSEVVENPYKKEYKLLREKYDSTLNVIQIMDSLHTLKFHEYEKDTFDSLTHSAIDEYWSSTHE